MKIVNLKLNNFCSFSSLNGENGLNLDGKNVIFFGKNGTGKTTLLKAVKIVFENINNALTKKRDFKNKIEKDCIKNETDSYNIVLSLKFNEGSVCKVECNSIDEKVKYSRYEEVIGFYNDYEKNDIMRNQPFFINYGIDRLNGVENVKVDVYKEMKDNLNLIDCQINYEEFIVWFKAQVDYINKIRIDLKDFDYNDEGISFVIDAMKSIFDEPCKNITYIIDDENIELEFVFKNEKKIYFNQLSDGEKTLVLLFGDIARRIVLCNEGKKTKKNLKKGEGIVVVDEIEMHLHPMWQRRIVNKLTEIFPNVQFILTTHSPIVLSEMNENFEALLVEKEVKNKVERIQRVKNISGYDINHILTMFMDSEIENEDIKNLKREIGEAINKKNVITLEKSIKSLEEKTDVNNEDVILAKINYERIKNAENKKR